VRRVTKFLDCLFTEEEESNGVIENIIKCSFEKMKNLEVNRSGTLGRNMEKKYLSKTMEEKLSGSSLSFKTCL